MNIIYHWIGIIVFWGGLSIGTWLALGAAWRWFMSDIWNHTYLCYVIDTIKVWYRFKYKKQPIDAHTDHLEYLKTNSYIKRMPSFLKEFHINTINSEIDRRKKTST